MENKTTDGTPYWSYGDKKSKQTIVMIHGYRGTHHGLEFIAENLPTYNVIIPDIPGFGKGTPLKKYDISEYAKWLGQFISDLTLPKKPTLVGHSFGSVITSAYASQNPNNIQNLVLINPIPAPVSEAKTITDFFGNAYYGLGGVLPDRLAQKWFSSKLMTLIASEFMIKNRDKANRQMINHQHLSHFSEFTDLDALKRSYLTSAHVSVKEFAPLITNKTLMIVGDKDDIAPLKKQHALQKLIPNATVKVIKDVGHLTHYETPEQVADSIKEFIGD